MTALGTILQAIGALCLAGRLLDPYWCYIIMTPGALILAIHNFRIREWAQAWLMIVFISINLTGIFNWGV